MASEFIGCNIHVTLNGPGGPQLRGVVANVVSQQLFLQDVTLLWNQQRLPAYTLDASNIADLEVASSISSTENVPTPTAASHPVPTPTSAPHTIHTEKLPTSFVDPAIVSYHKPPPTRRQPSLQPVSAVEAPGTIADGAGPSPISLIDGQLARSAGVGGAKQSSVSSIGTAHPHPSSASKERRDSQATAILTEPFDAMKLENNVVGVKQAQAKKHRKMPSQTAPGIIDVKDIHGSLNKSKKEKERVGKGRGWRITPLIEEIPATNKQSRRQRGRKAREEDQNGWATEDATDIQDMPEFDFETNLSKFNKRQVFDDIRKDDATSEGDRLVSFNRRARPGTNGGRNLHFTENVLDLPDTRMNDQWKSEAGETEEDTRGSHYSKSSGRGSKRASSRGVRPAHGQSKKGSLLPASYAEAVGRTASPRPLQRVATSPLNGSISGTKASFRLPNNKPCHCVSPLQMLEIEQLCTSELGLSEDMLSENAGRSISEAIFKSSASPSTAGEPHSEVRNVLFLVGNHKSGARAIAAARHLRNRRLRVTVIILGGERGDHLLEVVRKQLDIYKKGGGYVNRWDEYSTKLMNGSTANADGKGLVIPDVVVEALLGVHVTFDELRTDDQATAFEMIRWANRHGNVVSVDVPSGLSATSGLITEADGQLLVVNSRMVVALGAPKVGLLMSMAMDSDGAEMNWRVVAVDVGISSAAWQRMGSRRRWGVDFGSEWMVEVRFVAG